MLVPYHYIQDPATDLYSGGSRSRSYNASQWFEKNYIVTA